MTTLRTTIFQLVSIAILTLGFAQFSAAGVVSTGEVINAELRGERISKIEVLLAQTEVADQLQAYGVSQSSVMERVQNMTDAELLELEISIESQVAGADVVSVIGTVFVVLLILELVGVTDIFKSF